MHARARRSVTAGLGVFFVMAVGMTACGGGSEPVEAGAGAEAAPTAPPAEPGGSTEPDASEPAPSTEVAPAPDAADGPSSVDGLTAAELRTVVEAPSPTARRRSGPVAEQIAVADRTVWRISIPGRFELLSSRIIVAVGGRDVGEGVVAPDLTTLVAVTTDASVVVPGAAVTYRWGAGEPLAAGVLEVVR